MRPFRLAAATALLALLAAPSLPGRLDAQVVREFQVPLDPERGIVEVDAELRRELGLFPDVAGFVAARLFETVTGDRVLEITTREDGRTVRERRPLRGADLAELRGTIAAGLEARGMQRAVSRDGRGGLVLAETVLGLGFYGWAVPTALDLDNDRAILATYLLTAGASFLVPYQITRSITVTDAHRDAAVWGGTRGILYGLMLGDALTLGDDDEGAFGSGEPDFEDGRDDERVIVGLGLLGSVAGTILGYQVVDPARHDRGDVALWSIGGDFALAYGFGAATALGLYDADEICDEDVCHDPGQEFTTVGHLATMTLGLAGLYGARKWAEGKDYTVGDARALLSFGVLGGQVALPIAWAVFEDMDGGGEKGLAATVVAGSAASLWWGDRHLRGRAISDGDGLLVQAGHLAGGALAGGLTYLIDDGKSDELLYFTTTALGSVAGSLLTFHAVARRDAAPGSGSAGGGPSVEVSAAGLWAPLLARRAMDRTVRIPVVTIRH